MPKSKDFEEETLREAYSRLGSLSKVGDELGASASTISRWMDKYGIEKSTAPQNIERVEVECDNCGSYINRKPYRVEKYEKQYCDSKCLGEDAEGITGEEHPKYKGKINTNCETCDKPIEKYPSRSHRNNFFCSVDCRAEWQSENIVGESHHQFKGGKFYYGTSWYQKRKEVRQRDGNVCQVCGITEDENGRKPAVHHIEPVRSFNNPNNAHKMKNMVQVCQSCHFSLEPLTKEEQLEELQQTGLAAF
jgi:5-methylcytosine-specific restriction endonuclease McrA